MAVVVIFGMTPSDYEKREEIKSAVRCAIVNVVSKGELVVGDIGFSCPPDPKASDEENSPMLIVVERLVFDIRDREALKKEICEYFQRVCPKKGREINVIVKKASSGPRGKEVVRENNRGLQRIS